MIFIIECSRSGWQRKDLEPYIGSRGRVSEILNRKRPLSLSMIRSLAEVTNIPASILIQPYETEYDRISIKSQTQFVTVGS